MDLFDRLDYSTFRSPVRSAVDVSIDYRNKLVLLRKGTVYTEIYFGSKQEVRPYVSVPFFMVRKMHRAIAKEFMGRTYTKFSEIRGPGRKYTMQLIEGKTFLDGRCFVITETVYNCKVVSAKFAETAITALVEALEYAETIFQ